MPFPNKSTQFKKGNTKGRGRPKKLISALNEQLLQEGYEKTTNSQIADTYSLLIGLDFERLKEVIEDKAIPMLYRIIGKAMLDDDRASDILEIMLSRTYGKPVQPNKNNNEVTASVSIVDFSKLTNEELDRYISKGISGESL